MKVNQETGRNWILTRRLETVRFQEEGWQEPRESRDSCADLWETGGEIPPVYPTNDKILKNHNLLGVHYKSLTKLSGGRL